MVLSDKIQQSLGKVYLNRNASKINRRRGAFNLDTAQICGVVFTYTDHKRLAVVKEFLKYLSQKNIKLFALAYVDDKKIPDELVGESKINVINKKDFNWFHKPLNESIKDFTSRDFDILFNLNLEKNLALDFLMGLSRAKFKVGKYFENNDYCDMMIDISKNDTLENLVEQLRHYLLIINNK